LTFFQKCIPASLLSLVLFLSAREAKAQNTEKPVQQNPYVKGKISSPDQKNTLPSKIINGTVRDSIDSASLPGVSVSLKGTSLETYTDADGNFTLVIKNPSPNDTLVVSFIGFETQSVGVYGKTELSISLHYDTAIENNIVVGGICYRPWSPRSVWWKVKSLFTR
jgi:hypothetical protein